MGQTLGVERGCSVPWELVFWHEWRKGKKNLAQATDWIILANILFEQQHLFDEGFPSFVIPQACLCYVSEEMNL